MQKVKLFTLFIGLFIFTGAMNVRAEMGSGSCGANLTWVLNDDGSLVISGTGAMNDYTGSAHAPWFANISPVTSISLPVGLTYVGNYAFFHCTQVTSIVVPEGVTALGASCFAECRSLISLTLPSTLQAIENLAFSNCESLPSLTIPASVYSISFGVLHTCNMLTNVVVEAGNTTYDSRNNCNAIIKTSTNTMIAACANTVIPSSVTAIDNWYVFAGLNNLRVIDIPEGVQSLGLESFASCWHVDSLRIPSSLTTITDESFNGCYIHFIDVNPANPRYDSRDNCNAIIETATNTLVKGGLETVIPNTVTTIGGYAFASVVPLTTITIPESVDSLGRGALYNCKDMAEIKCKNVTPPAITTGDTFVFKLINKSIPVYVPAASIPAYQAAPGWNEFTNYLPLPEEEPICAIASGTLTETLNWALTCDNVLKLTGSGPMPDFNYPNYGPWNSLRHKVHALDLPAGLTTIGKYAFYQMDSLNTAVVVPEGVTSIGYCAFSGENQLPAITLPSTLQTMDGGVFSEDWALQSLTIPAAVRSIGSRLTEGCTSLTSIVVDANNMVFDSRENCNAVIQTATNKLVAGCHVTVIPNTVVTIGTQAFSSLRNMTQIRIPNSVTRLDSYCFQYCSGLTDLVIPSSLVDIDGSAFAGCKFNTLSVNPGNPRYDSRDNCNAFIETATNVLIKGCNTTVIPDEIEVIGEGAFWSCWNLKFINLPETVDSIAHNGLIYCKGLESITCFAVNPLHVGPQAFNYGTETSININPAIPVYVPNPSAYQAVPGWNYFTNFIALDSYYTVKALANHGQVTGTGTYAANSTVALVATPDEGFVFSQWSDGSTSSTKNFVVTCDTTLRAFFDKEEQEEQTIIAGQSTIAEVSEITISFEPIVDAVLYELKVYMHGRLVATVHINAFGQIVGDIIWAAPSRIQATTVDADPSVYQVNLSNLEFGQDYTFTLDSYNADEECISAQNGSFNVPQTPTDCRDIEGIPAATTEKIIENGRLLIIVNGQRYDAQGQSVE